MQFKYTLNVIVNKIDKVQDAFKPKKYLQLARM